MHKNHRQNSETNSFFFVAFCSLQIDLFAYLVRVKIGACAAVNFFLQSPLPPPKLLNHFHLSIAADSCMFAYCVIISGYSGGVVYMALGMQSGVIKT